ncbi:hypothetical protein ACTHAM_001537 [Cellulomonas soli]|uniref:hypothetical protein n=1 Tax=Cellulomonas soli TaxID=931535 RepID=UPI003F82B5ED
MTDELGRALRDLAEDAAHRHDTGGGLPTARLGERVRRARRTRRAVVGAGCVMVVGALVLGGAQLRSPRPGPVPASSPTAASPSPSPSPSVSASPEPAAAVLPAGDPSAPYGACGSLVTAAPAHPVDARFTAEVHLESTEVAAGQPLAVSTWVEPTADGPLAAVVPAAGPRLLVARDGVVVAIAGVHGDADLGWGGRILGSDHAETFIGDVELAVCDDGEPGVTAGRALPAGRYDVIASATVGDLGDDDSALYAPGGVSADLAAEGGALRSVASEPVTVTITGTAERPAATSEQALDLATDSPAPSCGGPSPTGPTRAAGLGVSVDPVDVAPVQVGQEAEVSATARLRYDGPGVLHAGLDLRVSYWVVRDGVVVGTSWVPTDVATTSLSIGGGSGTDLQAGPFVLTSCDEWGIATTDPLPAGTYTVYPGIWVLDGLRVWTPDGWFDATPGGEQVVFGEPFEVSVL